MIGRYLGIWNAMELPCDVFDGLLSDVQFIRRLEAGERKPESDREQLRHAKNRAIESRPGCVPWWLPAPPT